MIYIIDGKDTGQYILEAIAGWDMPGLFNEYKHAGDWSGLNVIDKFVTFLEVTYSFKQVETVRFNI